MNFYSHGAKDSHEWRRPLTTLAFMQVRHVTMKQEKLCYWFLVLFDDGFGIRKSYWFFEAIF